MPFKSQKQRKFLFINNPETAKEFAKKTKNIKALPEKAKKSVELIDQYLKMAKQLKDAEKLAIMFHEIYENLAPEFAKKDPAPFEDSSYYTPWEEIPENNKQLLIATCNELLEKLKDGELLRE